MLLNARMAASVTVRCRIDGRFERQVWAHFGPSSKGQALRCGFTLVAISTLRSLSVPRMTPEPDLSVIRCTSCNGAVVGRACTVSWNTLIK